MLGGKIIKVSPPPPPHRMKLLINRHYSYYSNIMLQAWAVGVGPVSPAMVGPVCGFWGCGIVCTFAFACQQYDNYYNSSYTHAHTASRARVDAAFFKGL